MKTIFRIFVLVLISPLFSIAQTGPVSVADAQKKLEALQLKGKGQFKVIDEKAQKVPNGDVITTSVCFCDSLPVRDIPYYNYFTRRYGLTTKDGKKFEPVYENLIYWENDQYLVKYYGTGPPNSYESETWYALIDRNFKVLRVYMMEGSYENFHRVKKNGKYGAIDGYASEKLPFVYDSLSPLSSSQYVNILVKERSFYSYAAKGKNKWGLITTENDTVVPFKYDFLGNSRGGEMVAKNKGKWGIVNHDDAVVVPFEYDSIVDGNFYLLKGKKWAVMPTGNEYKTAVHQFDELAFDPSGGGFGRIGAKWYFLSAEKVKENAPVFDGFHFDADTGPYVVVKRGDKYAVYDSYKGLVTEFIYSGVVDVLYEREWDGGTNYPVYHFIMMENGKQVEFSFRN